MCSFYSLLRTQLAPKFSFLPQVLPLIHLATGAFWKRLKSLEWLKFGPGAGNFFPWTGVQTHKNLLWYSKDADQCMLGSSVSKEVGVSSSGSKGLM